MPFPDDTKRGKESSLQDIAREYDVYCRLADTPHFLQMVEYSARHGIVLQGVQDGTLRSHLEHHGDSVSFHQRRVWTGDVATALHSLHELNVVHGDVKPENVLLDENLKAYLIDFSGSCIDGKAGTAMESVRFCLPRSIESNSTVQTDLFALGSTIYEIMTSKQPYHDLADEEVETLFENHIFPSLDGVPFGRIIRTCWEGTCHSAKDVAVSFGSQFAGSEATESVRKPPNAD